MAEVKKARLFLRRGTDTDRKTTNLCEGELGYSTDAFRVFVGTGNQNGGIPMGGHMFVSAGTAGPHFHTNLTEASAGATGTYAVSGDIAVFAAQSYTNAAGATVLPTTTAGTSATTVMLLTGAPSNAAATAGSWVAVNSGIPWGNLTVGAKDISVSKLYAGPHNAADHTSVAFNGTAFFPGSGALGEGHPAGLSATTLSATAITAVSAALGDLAGTGIRPVFVTPSGQLSAAPLGANEDISVGGIMSFISPAVLSAAWTGNTVYSGVTKTFDLDTPDIGIPSTATTVILSISWERYHTIGTSANQTAGHIVVGSTAPTLTAASIKVAKRETVAGSTQLFCPINNTAGALSITMTVNANWANITSSSGSGKGKWFLTAVGYL